MSCKYYSKGNCIRDAAKEACVYKGHENKPFKDLRGLIQCLYEEDYDESACNRLIAYSHK